MFRADTDVMRHEADQLAQAASDAGSVGAQAGDLANRVDRGKYDGQLTSKIANILSGVGAQGQSLQSRLAASSARLRSKAEAIDAVMQSTSSASMLSLGDTAPAGSGLTDMLERLTGLRWPYALTLLALGGVASTSALAMLGVFYGASVLWPKSPVAVTSDPALKLTTYRTTDVLRLRETAGLAGTVLMTLGAGSLIQATGQMRQADGHQWVEVIGPDNKRGWVAGEYLHQEAEPTPTPTRAASTASTGIQRKALLQTDPEDPNDILRFQVNTGETEYFWRGGKKEQITTVQDHIYAYGCLLTSFTMLLQDKGVQVSGRPVAVTDLYKANYAILQPGHTFEADKADGVIDIQTLNAQSTVVHAVSADYQQAGDTITFAEGSSYEEALRLKLNEHGSVIAHVVGATGDGHWIVVDSMNDDGSFRVRDSMKGLVEHALFSGDHATYKPAADRAYRNIEPVPPTR